MHKWFEQPIDEITRLLLRLEALFESYKRNTQESTEMSAGQALSTLVRILNVTDRSDLKNKLIAQVMQQVTTLMAMKQSPHIDTSKLTALIEQMESDLVSLRQVRQTFGANLRHNQLLNTVRTQLASPAGILSVDTPQYALWLQQPAVLRQETLAAWVSEFQLLQRVTIRVLSLLRESGNSQTYQAVRGQYEQALDPTQPCQLARVKVEHDGYVYPMISIGKHRISVQFYHVENVSQGGAQKYYDSLSFQLVLARL